jgi:hypothetical protein
MFWGVQDAVLYLVLVRLIVEIMNISAEFLQNKLVKSFSVKRGCFL